MTLNANNAIKHIKYAIFNQFPHLYCLTTTRLGGVSKTPFNELNLGENTNDIPLHVAKNIKQFKAYVKQLGATRIVLPNQVHGNKCLVVDAEFLKLTPNEQSILLSDCDALITSQPQVFIGIRTADCVPVCLYSEPQQIIAVIHAGWRGIANGIIQKTIDRLNILSEKHEFYAAIGPCIEQDKYEVGKDVVDEISLLFKNQFVCETRDGRCFLNLKKAAKLQLIQGGVPEANIEVSSYCTWKNNDKFYSYRKENGDTGRFLTGMLIP